ncbi:hypothetical protein MXF13_05975 [Leclercia adecarboxylata]|uniref:hypothetical protein n=1 Tax=Leclercia TaxID=83654 RepID=UPI0012E7B806|nr:MULTISPECIES: hypothetical protein [Leclercia]MCZ7837969.1 hypothetical protein [Leclercia adecarboxylata]MEB5749431.1 hypothetical protein [Leclercia adecarboxylata]QGW16112.1 hypothetical protein GNG29_05960 [Leclercia sp. Colony189]QVV59216.1 hypothetical protein JV208_05340 [Leclercia sp. Colony189]URM24134.1 hypothetical protein JJN11_06310 [Leclercia adecarboxylata]
MNYNNDVISYLQANNILALKLDRALTGVREVVSRQIETIGAGAKRALYYTSCFTDDYQDVCRNQKSEDIRFKNGVVHLFQNNNIAYEMLRIYFEQIFQYKTSEQLENIKNKLMAANVYIAASSFTNAGFALAVAYCVAIGMNLRLEMSALVGRKAGGVVAVAGIYGVIQRAADSAQRLKYVSPAYYAALYSRELEMMYFLVEPLFERAGAFSHSTSDSDIAELITKMIR